MKNEYGNEMKKCETCKYGNHGLSNFKDKILCTIDGVGHGKHQYTNHFCGNYVDIKDPYHAEILDRIEVTKGCWKVLKIGIFHNNVQVGSYQRNYPSHGLSTFYPFEQNGQWYALYSKDYTCTSIMTLPDCKDIGGEDPNEGGFCPVEYFIPRYKNYFVEGVHPEDFNHYPEQNHSWIGKDIVCKIYEGYKENFEESNGIEYESLSKGHKHCRRSGYQEGIFYENFAFVCGCVWGDDSSWKIQHIDLSKASEGIIKRSEAFGYIELPRNLSLKEAIDLDDERLEISIKKNFNIKTDGSFEHLDY